MPELQDAVKAKLSWAQHFVKLSTKQGTTFIDEDIYSEFMSLLYSAMYVFVVQGRLSGLQSIKLSQLTQLFTKGYAMSSQFKTAAKFR